MTHSAPTPKGPNAIGVRRPALGRRSVVLRDLLWASHSTRSPVAWPMRTCRAPRVGRMAARILPPVLIPARSLLLSAWRHGCVA